MERRRPFLPVGKPLIAVLLDDVHFGGLFLEHESQVVDGRQWELAPGRVQIRLPLPVYKAKTSP